MDDGMPGAAMNENDNPHTPGPPGGNHVPSAPEWCLQRQIALLMTLVGVALILRSL
jgi:hypothetical protein